LLIVGGVSGDSFFPGPGGFSLPVLSLDPVSSMPKERRLILDFTRALLQLGLKVRVTTAGSPFNFLLLVCDTFTQCVREFYS
jgi:hypothetical protein